MPFLETPFFDSFLGTSFVNDLSQEPIEQQMDMKLLSDYCHEIIDFPTGPLQTSGVSQEGINFVRRLLKADPSSRMSAKDGLESPWLFEASEVVRKAKGEPENVP